MLEINRELEKKARVRKIKKGRLYGSIREVFDGNNA
jgi:hypothetical protein